MIEDWIGGEVNFKSVLPSSFSKNPFSPFFFFPTPLLHPSSTSYKQFTLTF